MTQYNDLVNKILTQRQNPYARFARRIFEPIKNTVLADEERKRKEEETLRTLLQAYRVKKLEEGGAEVAAPEGPQTAGLGGVTPVTTKPMPVKRAPIGAEELNYIRTGDGVTFPSAAAKRKVLPVYDRYSGTVRYEDVPEGTDPMTPIGVGENELGYDRLSLEREKLAYKKKYDALQFKKGSIDDTVKNLVASARVHYDAANLLKDKLYGAITPEVEAEYKQGAEYMDQLRPYWEQRLGTDIEQWVVQEVPEFKSSWLGIVKTPITKKSVVKAEDAKKSLTNYRIGEMLRTPDGDYRVIGKKAEGLLVQTPTGKFLITGYDENGELIGEPQ